MKFIFQAYDSVEINSLQTVMISILCYLVHSNNEYDDHLQYS